MNERATVSALPQASRSEQEKATDAGQPTPSCLQAQAHQWVQAVYGRQFDFVWRTLRGLGVPEASVDDAVQDVFIVLYRRRDDYREDRSEKSWLFRIARYVASNHHRTRRRKGGHLPLNEELVASQSAQPDQRAELEQAFGLLERFLNSLDQEQRDVFVSMELSGLSTRQAAEALGVKQNTVSSRLRLARGRWERFVREQTQRAAGELT